MKYKVCAEASSFDPLKINWVIYRRKFFLFQWEYVGMYRTKEDAVGTVKELISCAGPFYFKE